MKNTQGFVADAGIRLLVCACPLLAQWEHANLRAPFWRFYWNDRPGAAIKSEGKTLKLTPDVCALIGPETNYASHLRQPVRHLYIHFLAALPTSSAPLLHFFPSAPIKETLRELRDKLAQDGGLAARDAVLAHYLVAYALLQIPSKKFRSVSYDRRVEEVIRLLEKNPSSPPDNAFLAAKVGLHRNSFIRLFRQATGYTPQKYATRLRIERACHLLHDAKLGIKEIAAALGFCDRYHFSRLFRRWRGMGPAEFRRRVAV